MRTTHRWVAALATFALALSACADGEDEGDVEPATDATDEDATDDSELDLAGTSVSIRGLTAGAVKG